MLKFWVGSIYFCFKDTHTKKSCGVKSVDLGSHFLVCPLPLQRAGKVLSKNDSTVKCWGAPSCCITSKSSERLSSFFTIVDQLLFSVTQDAMHPLGFSLNGRSDNVFTSPYHTIRLTFEDIECGIYVKHLNHDYDVKILPRIKINILSIAITRFSYFILDQ